MARGKYAARAANARAGSAEERIAQLERQLADERATHGREVADLKMRVQQLSGQLTSDIGRLAAAEAQRTTDHFEAQIANERQQRQERALKLWISIVDWGLSDPRPSGSAASDVVKTVYAGFAELVDLEPGDLFSAEEAAGGHGLRSNRRTTVATMRKGRARLRRFDLKADLRETQQPESVEAGE